MIEVTDAAAEKLEEALRGAHSGRKSIRVLFDGFG